LFKKGLFENGLFKKKVCSKKVLFKKGLFKKGLFEKGLLEKGYLLCHQDQSGGPICGRTDDLKIINKFIKYYFYETYLT
jgi:hypothetical protein